MLKASESWQFARVSWKSFTTTGAVLPSSPFLARAMTDHLCGKRPPLRILEAGPGTGPVTRQIAQRLQPGDQFDIVELNPSFVEILRERVQKELPFARCRDRVNIMQAPVEEVPGEGVYDRIISGLPLNNFPVELVERILAAFRRLAKPGGLLTYFEYAAIREMKMPLVGASERARLAAVGEAVARYIDKYQEREELVWFNVPPAIVRHLRFTA